MPLAVFALPGVREPFSRSFAIHRGLRTVKRDDDVLTVLADRERRQLIVGNLSNIDLRFVDWPRRIVRPSGEATAPDRFERFRVPAAHVAPVRLFPLPDGFFGRSVLCTDKRAESDRY